MEDGIFIGGVFFLALILGFIFRKPAEKKRDKQNARASAEIDLLAALGKSVLIEYTPTDRFEDVTKKVLSKSLASKGSVVLLTQAPRSGIYYEEFRSDVKSGQLKMVNITSENPLARPQMFRVGKQEHEPPRGKPDSEITAVSINNLEFAFEIVEELAPGGVLIFEALTGIILGLGSEKRESAYKFFSSIVEELSEKDRTLVALLNRGAHEKETVSAYEGLFMNIFKIDEGCLVSLKGARDAVCLLPH